MTMTSGPERFMSDWESLCKRCGRCCFEKWIRTDGTIRFTRVPCRHLDVVTRECRVYAKRLEVDEGCVQLTPENVQTLGWLPADCSYLEHLRGGTTGDDRHFRRRRKRSKGG